MPIGLEFMDRWHNQAADNKLSDKESVNTLQLDTSSTASSHVSQSKPGDGNPPPPDGGISMCCHKLVSQIRRWHKLVSLQEWYPTTHPKIKMSK